MVSSNDSGSKDKNNKYINNNNIKMIEKSAKTYKWCWKCSSKLKEGSIDPFCSDFCRSEFYAENAKEIDAVWREIRGVD